VKNLSLSYCFPIECIFVVYLTIHSEHFRLCGIRLISVMIASENLINKSCFVLRHYRSNFFFWRYKISRDTWNRILVNCQSLSNM